MQIFRPIYLWLLVTASLLIGCSANRPQEVLIAPTYSYMKTGQVLPSGTITSVSKMVDEREALIKQKLSLQ